MSAQVFTSAMYLGSFLVAIWAYVRLPVLRPRTLGGAVAHVAASFAFFHVSPHLLDLARFAPPPCSVVLAVVAVVASLGYVYVSWLWLVGRIRDGLGRPRGGHPVRAAG